jgi:hypothetical protein
VSIPNVKTGMMVECLKDCYDVCGWDSHHESLFYFKLKELFRVLGWRCSKNAWSRYSQLQFDQVVMGSTSA